MAQGVILSLTAKLLADTALDANSANNLMATLTKALTVAGTEFEHSKKLVAASQTDEALSFGGVTNARLVLIIVDAAITVKLTGSATPNNIPVENVLLLTASAAQTFTAVSVTTGASPAGGVNIEYLIIG